MAGKTSTKSKSKPKHKGDTFTMAAYPRSTSVDIKKVNNGFVVSSYGPKGDIAYIAKDRKEAQAYANKVLGELK